MTSSVIDPTKNKATSSPTKTVATSSNTNALLPAFCWSEEKKKKKKAMPSDDLSLTK